MSMLICDVWNSKVNYCKSSLDLKLECVHCAYYTLHTLSNIYAVWFNIWYGGWIEDRECVLNADRLINEASIFDNWIFSRRTKRIVYSLTLLNTARNPFELEGK